jgi:hypothetical protein
MTDDEIFQRLFDHEDNWTERKQAHQTDEIRKTLVAFANSLPENEKAILFVGVSEKFAVVGIGDNPSKTQMSIRKSAEEWCYPPIKHQIRSLKHEGHNFLAVIIETSHEKPHFAGPAFVRKGSESTNASGPEFQEMIASRSSQAWPLIEARRRKERVTVIHYPLGRSSEYQHMSNVLTNCEIEEVTPHWVRFQSISGPIPAPISAITVARGVDGLIVTVDGL